MKLFVKYLSLVVSVFLFAIGIAEQSISTLVAATVFMFVFALIFSLSGSRKGVLIIFEICFFTFLLGRILLESIDAKKWWIEFSDSIAIETLIAIFLSQLSIVLGAYVADCYLKNENKEISFTLSEKYDYKTIWMYCKIIYWITFPFAAYVIIDKIMFVQANSYVDYYNSYGGVGIVASRLSEVNKIIFFLFLASMPFKKDSRIVIYSYAFINTISLLAGGRTDAVVAILVLCYYFVLRDRLDSDHKEVWVSKRLKLFVIICVPFAIVFLSAWNYIRNDTYQDMSFWDLFFGFFKSQGGAYRHIGYSIKYKGALPQNFYTFGPIINFLRNNIVVSAFTGFKMPAQNTVDMAMSGFSFGQAISYQADPSGYLAGFGMGSSYIAELMYDFGYIGVIAFNFIFGYILSKLSKTSSSKFLGTFFMLLILDSILTMPRSACLSWVTSLTSITMWIVVAFILIVSKRRYYGRQA